MNKLAVFASAVTLALAGSSIAAANGMGPGGFGHHNLRGGPGGFGAPNLPVVTVAQLQQASPIARALSWSSSTMTVTGPTSIATSSS